MCGDNCDYSLKLSNCDLVLFILSLVDYRQQVSDLTLCFVFKATKVRRKLEIIIIVLLFISLL